MLLVTHIPAHAFASSHTLLCKTTAAKAWEGGEGGRVQSRASSGGVLSLISLPLKQKSCTCECLHVWGRVNIKMWVVTSEIILLGRLSRVCVWGVRVVLKLVNYACNQFHIVWGLCVICVFLYFVFICFPVKSRLWKLYIHPSYGGRGVMYDTWATHHPILRLSQWSNKDSRLISALRINSSRCTGGRCTTCSLRRKQTTGSGTATLGRGSSAGKPPPSVLLDEGMILLGDE